MPITILETLNWPGGGLSGQAPKVTGDDRFGFDETAGTAWVLDGATDIGPYRLFDTFESDAAWMADHLNQALITRNPDRFPDIRSFFADVLANVRAAAVKKSRVALDKAHPSTLPIASGIWMWAQEGSVTFVRLGDCLAVIAPPEGALKLIEQTASGDRESETSRKLNAMSSEDKMKGLQEIRAAQNTVPDYAVFGLSPHAVNNLVIEEVNLPEGTHILLMSDGMWRLVEVYGLMTPQSLMDRAISDGIEALARDLRAHEKSLQSGLDIRIKASDDASAILLRL